MPQVTPQSLEQMYNLPVGMYYEGQDWMNKAQQSDAADLQGVVQNNQFNQQANPLKLRGLDLANQTAQAGIGGVQARSDEAQRSAKIGALLNDEQIASMRGKYTAEHIQQLSGLGQLSLMGAEQAWSNPIGAAARLKSQWQQAGFGGQWNPKWDSLDAGHLAMELSNFGQGIQATGSKLNDMMQKEQFRAQTAQALQERKLEAQAQATQLRLAAARQIVQERKATDPKSLEQSAVKLRALAREETNPELAQALNAQADQDLADAVKLKSASAQISSGDKVNIPQLNKGVLTDNATARGTTGPKAGTAENPIKLD